MGWFGDAADWVWTQVKLGPPGSMARETDQERTDHELALERSLGVNLNDDPRNPNPPPGGAAGALWAFVKLAAQHPVLTLAVVAACWLLWPLALAAFLGRGYRR